MVSERLQVCLKAGNLLALFPLLGEWSRDELRLLLEDIETFYETAEQDIDRIYEQYIFKPEVFFNDSLAKATHEARDRVRVEIFGICAEISSVAYYVLKERYGEEQEDEG